MGHPRRGINFAREISGAGVCTEPTVNRSGGEGVRESGQRNGEVPANRQMMGPTCLICVVQKWVSPGCKGL